MKIKKLTINEVCKFIGGSQPEKETFSKKKFENFVRLIQIRDYKSDDFITYIPKNSTSKFCDADDIMIGRYGPPIFQILRGLKGAYNVALIKAVPKENIDKDYLYYYLKQKHIFKFVERLSPRTGGQTGVDLEMLKKYPILLPKLDDQKLAANVLLRLDKKIELNNKIIKELDALSKLLYNYWFIKFNFPSLNDEPYRDSGGKMNFNEILNQEIPEGWQIKKLKEIAYITMGSSPPGSSLNTAGDGMIFFQGSSDFGYKFPSVREFTTKPIKLAKAGEILMSVRAPVGSLNIADSDCSIGRGLSALKSKDNAFAFLFNVMIGFEKMFEIRCRAGTTFGSITKPDLEDLKVLYPPEDILKKYEKELSKYQQKIISLQKENLKIEELKELLLPLLMNNRIKFKTNCSP